MVKQNSLDNERSALVVINSFDCEKDDIEDEMTRRRIYTEVFEIDRLRSEDRNDYLNCFQELYDTRQLPLIFLGDKYIGNFSHFQAHFDATKML